MENKICQSCGRPMTAEEQFGRNADGSKNGEYCSYCYRDGAFTEDCAMDEMIDHCLQFLDEFNKDMEHPYQGSALPLSYNSNYLIYSCFV